MTTAEQTRLKNLRSKKADPKCKLTQAELTMLKSLTAKERQAPAKPAALGS